MLLSLVYQPTNSNGYFRKAQELIRKDDRSFSKNTELPLTLFDIKPTFPEQISEIQIWKKMTQ